MKIPGKYSLLTGVWMAGALLCIALLPAKAQVKPEFFAESAIRLTTDAEGTMVAPSISLGAGMHLGRRWAFTSAYTYFGARYTDENFSEKLRIHTLDLLAHFYFHNLLNPAAGFYIGTGYAVQRRHTLPEEPTTTRKVHGTGAFTVGYRFPVIMNKKQRTLAIDCKAYGPYSEPGYLEVLTQLMLGIRLIY